jgi:hypothetical protein
VANVRLGGVLHALVGLVNLRLVKTSITPAS